MAGPSSFWGPSAPTLARMTETQASSPPPATQGISPQKEIAHGVVAIYKEYLGRGPRAARCTITDEFAATVIQDGLTKAEETLVREGEADSVREIRRKFQIAMRGDITELVERVTGRKALSFVSDHEVEHDFAVEMVIFAPVGD